MTQSEFSFIEEAVRKAGIKARENQNLIHRTYKEDGSVLTETDLMVTEKVVSAIREVFGNSVNIITEETDEGAFNNDAPYTFVLDPIDGTDSYSQGLATWAVALGILDKDRNTAGAIIFAPRFGIGTQELFVSTCPGSADVFVNGKKFEAFKDKDSVNQLCIGSNALYETDLSQFRGKIRSYGSSILHLLVPVLFSHINGVVDPLAYVWDMCASLCIMRKLNADITYIDGTAFEFTDDILFGRKKYSKALIGGTAKAREHILSFVKER